jgi:hypothetical protein
MSTLGGLRTTLVEALAVTDAAQVLDHVPARIVPPALVVSPGVPYVRPGTTYGTHLVTLVVTVVVGVGTNATLTATTDDLVEQVVTATRAAFDLVEVSPFYQFTSGGAAYLAADITITDTVTFD